MNKVIVGFGTSCFLFTGLRWAGAFGEREVVIPKAERHNRNSWGENWFTVKSNLFWDEVVEYEEGPAGNEWRVASYGWSFGRLKIKYE